MSDSHTDATLLDDGQRIRAVARLGMMRDRHPELRAAEADARLALAAAIIAWDEAEQAQVPGRHTLHEQAAVNQASTAYAQALADLLRGEAP